MIDVPFRDGHGTVCRALSRRDFLGRAAGLGITAAATTALPGAMPAAAADEDGDLFLLGLEEHFATPELQRLNGIKFPQGVPRFDINDVGAGRITDMDAAGIDIQVLSALTPGAQNLSGAAGVAYARKLNSWVATEVIPAHPARFRAFATLPLSVPEAAPDELEYAVRELGFLGCMTYGAIHGKFLDHADFAPVLARAEALDVPIYIHPNWASPQVMDIYYNGLGNEWVSRVLSGAGYGWHQEVALQCLRMISSGVFDRFPNLQIIVGHMGEGLPFFYWRFGDDLARITADTLLKPVQQYFHDNFWITTSAFFRDELLRLVLSVMGEDRVMFAVDYPFVSNKEGADWLRAVDLPWTVKEKIAHKNAEKLLKIGPF
ncbi:MAG: amidohydrolase family protein [Rhodospirillales bacterium]|nr:amidohydrolase family protein [Rhodospirillales bacterium]